MTDLHVDVLGSIAFNPVKNDMLGNVKVFCPYAAISPSRHWLMKKNLESPRPPISSAFRVRESPIPGRQ